MDARRGMAVVVAQALVTVALGQESIFTQAATQPSVGHWVSKHQYRLALYDRSDGVDLEGTEHAVVNEVFYGITPKVSASLSVPLVFRDLESPSGDTSEEGFADLTASVKVRLWQEDPGPVDTRRLSAFASVEVPTGEDAFSSDSVDPTLGAIFMLISGRHGFNLTGEWKFTTGDTNTPMGWGDGLSDGLRAQSAYLYRVAPETYGTELAASVYVLGELVVEYETNGDYQVMVGPGVLYEAADFALEAGVLLPVASELEHRPETTLALRVGVRLLF